MVLENFFEALKSRDYERCGNYLAENENFMITDNTGYSFVNILTDKAMSYLDYSQTDACNINNVEASCKIRVTALNIGKLSECVRENFVDLEYEYLVEHDKRSIDAQQAGYRKYNEYCYRKVCGYCGYGTASSYGEL